MSRLRWRLASVCTLLLTSSSLWAADPAPPLMRPPSKVTFVSTGLDFTPAAGSSFGMDETGAVYGMKGNFVTCWPKGSTTDDQGKLLYSMEVPGKPLGIFRLGMTADHTHALFGRVNEGTLTLGKLRCDTVQPDVLSFTYLEEPALATYVQPGAEEGRRLSSTPAGAPCFPFGDVLKCFGPDKSIVRSLAVADVKPLLDINPDWRLSMFSMPPPNYTEVTPPGEVWHFNSFTFLPDGRLFAIINLEVTPQIPGAVPSVVQWLVEQSADGKIRVRSRATLRSQTKISPLGGVMELHYDAEHQTLMAWPALTWDLKANDQQATSKIDGGSPSIGMRVYPVDGELESGYLSLSKTYNNWFSRQYRGPTAFPRPNGGMLLEMGVGLPVPNNYLGNGRLFDVKVDADSLDLDLDGLTAAEEKALGTSVWLPDSDFGGNSDRDEVIAGAKPLDASDDPARDQDLHRMAYSISSLLRWRVGDGGVKGPTTDPWGSVKMGGGRMDEAPLCFGGTCRASSGEIVATYPKNAVVGDQQQSVDGRMVLMQGANGYEALQVPEGISVALATNTEVAQLLGTNSGTPRFFPVSRNEVYVSRDESRRIVVFGDGPPRLVFDLDAIRCNSGMGCPTDQGFSGFRYTLNWLGYDAKLGRMLVTVKEFENNLGRAWIMGVHPTLPPVLLAGIHELWGATGVAFGDLFSDGMGPSFGGIGIPTWAVDTGRGDLLTDYGRRDPYLHQLPSDLELFAGPVRRVWSDTLVQTGDDGLYEVVQIPEKTDPGELLLYTYTSNIVGSEHGTLWHIPARGGKAEVFQLPKMEVSGMNVAPDGRVCLASPNLGVFMQVRAHPLSFGLPNEQLTELHVGKVVDCDYGPDGRPHLLMTDPPRVLIWNGKDDAKSPADMLKNFETVLLDAGKTPFQLLVDKDGKDRVLYDGGELLGMGKMQDGSIAEVDAATQRLRIHGELVGPDLSTWVNDLKLHYPGQVQFSLAAVSWKALRVHVAQRPDGLIAVLPYTPIGNVYVDAQTSPPTTVLVWDPRTGQTGELTPLLLAGMYLTHALAVLPGGTATDPWTGEPLAFAPGGNGSGNGMGGDTQGGASNAAESGNSGQGGCSAGSSTGASAPVSWLGLCAAVAIAFRRRAPKHLPVMPRHFIRRR